MFSVRALLLGLIFAAGSVALCEDPHSSPEAPSDAILPFAIPVAPATKPLDPVYEPPPKRLFGVIPNYRADQFQAQYTPISTRQKYAIARSDSFDWPNYFLLAGYALQSQIASGGGFSHNGGLTGFGKYYGRSVGDQIIGSYVTEAILPALLHEDPRFFRLGKGPIWYRAYNAASRIVIVQKDDGSTGFAIAEVAGNAGVVALTTAYYPESRSASEAMERFGMALGNDMISNLLTEFWPDIKRRLPFHHHA